MNLKRNRGFTLLEILMVVAIVGVIATAAIAPLVYTIVRVVETEEQYNDEEALHRGLTLIVRDISEAMRAAENPLIRTVKKGILGVGDDYSLVIASTAPARQNLPAGSVVYRVVKRTAFTRLPEGLYRWIVPLTMPAGIDPERMDEEGAQLVLTGVTEMKIEILIPPDWSEEAYSGGLPIGMKISLSRKDKKVERIEWIPR